MKAGDGYRAQPNVTVLNNRNAREGTAALPYTEISERGTDKFNEIRLNRTRALRHNVSRQTPIALQHRIQQCPTLRIQCMPVHNLKPAAIGIHYQNVGIA